jgi:hypothetical protein
METMREKWTDERMDDMKDEMVRGFTRIEADVREVRDEIAGVHGGLTSEIAGVPGGLTREIAGVPGGLTREIAGVRDSLREEMSIEFAAVRAEMAANHRLQVQLSIGTIGTVVICFLGLLLSHA